MKKTGSGGGGSVGASGDRKKGRRSYGESATDNPPRVRQLLLNRFMCSASVIVSLYVLCLCILCNLVLTDALAFR